MDRYAKIYAGFCAATVLFGAWAIGTALAWQGEMDTVNPGQTAPGAVGGIGSESSWDDKGGPSQQGGSFKVHKDYGENANKGNGKRGGNAGGGNCAGC